MIIKAIYSFWDETENYIWPCIEDGQELRKLHT